MRVSKRGLIPIFRKELAQVIVGGPDGKTLTHKMIPESDPVFKSDRVAVACLLGGFNQGEEGNGSVHGSGGVA